MFKYVSSRFLAHAAMIAAAYAALTLAFAPLSFGPVQVRFSEALTLLAGLTPAAIPGLFAGCLLANIYTGNLIDIVLGSATTLAAALLSWSFRKERWLVPLPPVVLNALVVGCYLTFFMPERVMWMNMLTVGAGQVAACYVLPFYALLRWDRLKERLSQHVRY